MSYLCANFSLPTEEEEGRGHIVAAAHLLLVYGVTTAIMHVQKWRHQLTARLVLKRVVSASNVHSNNATIDVLRAERKLFSS